MPNYMIRFDRGRDERFEAVTNAAALAYAREVLLDEGADEGDEAAVYLVDAGGRGDEEHIGTVTIDDDEPEAAAGPRQFTRVDAMEAVLECVRAFDDSDLAAFLAECYPGEPVAVGDETRTYTPPEDREYTIEPADDGGELVRVGTGAGAVLGVVGALIVSREGRVVGSVARDTHESPETFDRAMKAIDPTFDRNDWGHG